MRNVKKITIIGGGLYGCLTALKIKKKFKNSDIEIIESGNDILNSLKSVNIQNLEINNGFHGIEIPRAQKLFEFLNKRIKEKFIIKKQRKFIILENKILKENYDLDNVDEKIKSYFLIKKIQSKNYNSIYNKLSINFKRIIKYCGYRYSLNIKDILHLFIPWFLPRQFQYLSNDEGDKFRYKVRKNLSKSFYAFPKKRIFYSLKHKFKKEILRQNIKIRKNSKIFSFKNNFYLNQILPENKISNRTIFLCTSPVFIIKNSEKKIKDLMKNKRYLVNLVLAVNNKIEYFSEILCLNLNFPELSRLSLIKQNKDESLLQLEILLKDQNLCNEKFFNKRLKKFFSNLEIKRNIYIKKYKILGFKITRNLYFPTIKTLKECNKFIDQSLKLNENQILGTYSILPMNMSKSWIYSDRNLKLLKN